MGILDNLTQGPPATSNQSSSTIMPSWYTDAMRGLTAQGAGVASRPYVQYQGPRVAGWAPEHRGALSMINQGVGAWTDPVVAGINAMSNVPGQVAGTFRAAGEAAGGAAGAIGPAQSWNQDALKQYMSPYTTAVVDEIARVGRRNLEENLIPTVNNAFVGAGGFGSTRNADILARTMRDANADILGQQARALESGYTTAGNLFTGDANRALSADQARANAMIQGAGTAINAGNTWADVVRSSATGLGALSQVGQGLQGTDIDRLVYAGDRQQQQAQKQMDVNYGDFTQARDWDQNQLNNFAGLLKGVQVPSITNTTGTNQAAQPSTLQWIAALMGLLGGGSSATPATAPAPAPATAPPPIP